MHHQVTDELAVAVDHAITHLLTALDQLYQPAGYWQGRFCASAFATGLALTTLSLRPEENRNVAQALAHGYQWLVQAQHADGGWSDTPCGASSLHTTLLCMCALKRASGLQAVYTKAANYWTRAGGYGGLHAMYGRDYTFLVPLLNVAARCGLISWQQVPPLPVSLLALPPWSWRWLRLPMVSFALPMFISMALLRRAAGRPGNCPSWLQRKGLNMLAALQPVHGGYLECPEATSFVLLALDSLGASHTQMACKACEYLLQTQRADGSWSIVTDISVWVTILVLRALQVRPQLALLPPRLYQQQQRAYSWLQTQMQVIGPYRAWQWTPGAGGLPESDDTSLALAVLSLATCNDLSVQNNGGCQERVSVPPQRLAQVKPSQEDRVFKQIGVGAPESVSRQQLGTPQDRSSPPDEALPQPFDNGRNGIKQHHPLSGRANPSRQVNPPGHANPSRQVNPPGYVDTREQNKAPEQDGGNEPKSAVTHLNPSVSSITPASKPEAGPAKRGLLCSNDLAGVQAWLRKMQNHDGGWPTFARGSGHLPFDRSGSDLTAHVLEGLLASGLALDETVIRRGLTYLQKKQAPAGYWEALWFGAPYGQRAANRPYATSQVLWLVGQHPRLQAQWGECITRACQWIADNQNQDGGWGNQRGHPSTAEETALALSGLLVSGWQAKAPAIVRGVQWLLRHQQPNGSWTANPIGLYYQALRYAEPVYPLAFGLMALNQYLQACNLK